MKIKDIIRRRFGKKPEPEYGHLWLRLGVTVKLTQQDIDLLLNGNKEQATVLWKAWQEGRITPNGDTYVPGEVIEDYNKENGTSYEEAETGWNM